MKLESHEDTAKRTGSESKVDAGGIKDGVFKVQASIGSRWSNQLDMIRTATDCMSHDIRAYMICGATDDRKLEPNDSNMESGVMGDINALSIWCMPGYALRSQDAVWRLEESQQLNQD